MLKAGTSSLKAQLSPPKQQLPPLGDSNSKLFSLTHLEKILIIDLCHCRTHFVGNQPEVFEGVCAALKAWQLQGARRAEPKACSCFGNNSLGLLMNRKSQQIALASAHFWHRLSSEPQLELEEPTDKKNNFQYFT